jgi:hypothetical protein
MIEAGGIASSNPPRIDPRRSINYAMIRTRAQADALAKLLIEIRKSLRIGRRIKSF